MPVERSAGAVVFYRGKKGREYLLLHHPEGPTGIGRRGYWSFPKGHIEKGEMPRETAAREIIEETGLSDLDFIPGFLEMERYIYTQNNEEVAKSVVWFLAQVKRKRVALSAEHIGAAWLSYGKAYKKVFYPGTKRLLKKVHRFIAQMK